MKLGKYSIGIGDRFGKSSSAQLKAVMDFSEKYGHKITPVWNKSFREHSLIGTTPAHTAASVKLAVEKCAYTGDYFLDADHINLKNIEQFLAPCNFFTIDVADKIGKECDREDDIARFKEGLSAYIGRFSVTEEIINSVTKNYLYALYSAKECCDYILEKKKGEEFVIEVSMDETSAPQTPAELFCIVYGLSMYNIPASTIAPKFSGEFHKGVDYIGDPEQFQQEFADDIDVLEFAKKEFGLTDIKLSVHSGSDKFSLYPLMKEVLAKKDAGVHLKTAGTTWLAEVVGLAKSGIKGLQLVKEIYETAYAHYDELIAPYASVVSIDRLGLPLIYDVAALSCEEFVSMLDHDQDNPLYSSNFRQFIHISFKIAAENPKYTEYLEKYAESIDREVYDNIYTKHLSLVF